MPNHFHLAVRMKDVQSLEDLQGFPNLQGFENLEGLNNIAHFYSQQFSNFFNAYTKAFNKQQNRRGGLFIPSFERKIIDDDKYFRELIHYIHFNPVHHGFVSDLRDWKYSSFESFFSNKSTQLARQEVISWFENKENFWAFHQKEIDCKMALELEALDD
jgi:REP element-mobilizing transposase RayT